MSARILIVDDSLTVRMDLAEAFGGAGFEALPCASAGEATVFPFLTTRRIASSSATVHSTSTAVASIPPLFSGSGARRVQSTKPSGAGSPDITPSGNGYCLNFGAA